VDKIIIDYLVNEHSGEFIFRTSEIDIMKIDACLNGALLLLDMNSI
jgi:hypothetical protein